MLTRWLERKDGSGVTCVRMMCAWMVRPRMEQCVETADSSKLPSRF